jgi:uncharacterized spore protein YtfJ
MKKTIAGLVSLWACTAWWTVASQAQSLAKPLADFDRMVSELRTSAVVGEPISAGEATVIPFASVQFGFGSAGATGGALGSMGVKTTPLGVLIVEGDEVRVELLPEHAEKSSSMMQQLIQGIIDRKVSFMVNGINLGNATGSVAELTPMMKDMMGDMMGQTNMIVNGLNLGNLEAPRTAAITNAGKTIAELEAAAAKNPTAENYYNLGEALKKNGQKDKAAEAYKKAIALRPGYADAVRALAELKK